MERLNTHIKTQNYVILQVAESYFNNSFHFKQHLQHCDLELTYPLTNGMICIIDGKTERLNRHDIHISFRDENHELSSSRKCRYQTLALNFKAGSCFSMLEEIKKRFNESRIFHSADISPILTSIMSEFIESELPFSESKLDSLITLLLVKILRSHFESTSTNVFTTEEKFPSIINYLDMNYLKICSLNELETKFGYSYSHISRLFKSLYGITPREYLESKKMDYSLTLLKQKLTITEIAERLGYSTPYNFSRAFKKHFGASPKNYK